MLSDCPQQCQGETRSATSSSTRTTPGNSSWRWPDRGEGRCGPDGSPRSGKHRRIHEFRSPDRPGADRLRLLQSRDTGQGPEVLLRRRGYRVAKGVGVDMFPFTEHVETVVLLSKEKSTRRRCGCRSRWKIWICPASRRRDL